MWACGKRDREPLGVDAQIAVDREEARGPQVNELEHERNQQRGDREAEDLR